MIRSPLTTALQLAIRSALSAALAVAIAQFLQLQHPLYALIGAVIVSDVSPKQTRDLALRRLAGTVVGAGVGASLSEFIHSTPLAIGLGILLAMFLSGLLRMQAAAKVAGYVCGIVVLEHGAHPWMYALFRLIETMLGIGMAVLVSFVPKLIHIDVPEKRDS